jgi:hypothetical protein
VKIFSIYGAGQIGYMKNSDIWPILPKQNLPKKSQVNCRPKCERIAIKLLEDD